MTEQDRQAKAARGRAEADAGRIAERANTEAAKLIDAAEQKLSEADQRVLDAEARVEQLRAAERQLLAAQTARKQESGKWARFKRAFWPTVAPVIVLVSAVGMTASGEYALAALVGVPVYLAWLLPTCVDVWTMCAMRAKAAKATEKKATKEIVASLLTMIGANVTYHLAAGHLVGMAQASDGHWHPTWELISIVACIAPIVVWRVHALMEHNDETAPAETAAGETAERETSREIERETAVGETVLSVYRPTETALGETVPALVPAQATGGLTLPPAGGDYPHGAGRPAVGVGETRSAGGGETRSRETAAARETGRHARAADGETGGAAARPRSPRSAPRETAVGETGRSGRVLTETEREIIARHMAAHADAAGPLPLEDLAVELGVSKPTASRRVAVYRALPEAQ